MKNEKYLNRILNFIDRDYNKNTISEISFDLYDNVLKFAIEKISSELVEHYGIEEGSDEYYIIIKSWIRKNYGDGNLALPGDRIVLNNMPDDPFPIESGAEGLVVDVKTITFPTPEDHLIVKWDNGRKLNLIKGIDEFEVIVPENDKKYFINSISWL